MRQGKRCLQYQSPRRHKRSNTRAQVNFALVALSFFGAASCRNDTDNGDGSDPPAVCTTGTPCVDNDDCEGGERCNEFLEPPECQSLYCGNSGTVCSGDELCAEGYWCVEIAEPPVCSDGGQGDACGYGRSDEYGCQEGLWCKPSGLFNGTCSPPGNRGETCRDEDSCIEELWCDSIENDPPICDQLHGVGEACLAGYGAEVTGCQEDLWCDNSGYPDEPTVCTPLGEDGDFCWGHSSCEDDYYCDTEGDPVCVYRRETGEDCEIGLNPTMLCREELYCRSSDETCQPRAAEGESCGSSTPDYTHCIEGYHCSASTSTCQPTAEEGETCDPSDDWACAAGLYCSVVTGVCEPYEE